MARKKTTSYKSGRSKKLKAERKKTSGKRAIKARATPRASKPTGEAALTRLALVDHARRLLLRSHWNDIREKHLSRLCRELVKRLSKLCPDLKICTVLDAGEVAGDMPIDKKEFQTLLTAAAGANETPRVIWSDGTNELVVELARISVKTLEGLVQVSIPVACEETGAQSIVVSFATGSPDQPAGLIFATETIPEGPAEIVELWGESLIALAWSSVLRALSTVAKEAGTDRDGAGLIAAGVVASAQGLNLSVMARHAMDRIRR